MERFRVEVGRSHGIDPGDLFGAMAYEAALMGAHIDRVDIFDDYSTIDFPRGMRQELFDALKKVRVGGQRLRLSSPEGDKKRGGKDKKRDGKKGSKADETKPKRKKDRHRNRKKRGK